MKKCYVLRAIFILSIIVMLIVLQGGLLFAGKYTGNPVVPIGNTGQWDEAGVGAACVIKDGTTYKMWYTGIASGPISKIGYATSNDGKVWTKSTSNPVLIPGASETWWDSEGVGSPCVIKDGTTYKMWYTGYQTVGGVKVPQIGYATWDGVGNWVKSTSNPVLPKGASGAWDQDGVLSACVILDGGQYKMWYTGRSGGLVGNLRIGYATSSNGVSWARYGGTGGPVLPAGSTGAWDSSGVGVASVVKDGTNYKMLYTGYTGSGTVQSGIGAAKSTDGTTWTRNDSNPVIAKGAIGSIGSIGSFEETGTGAPALLMEGTSHRVWFSGLDAANNPRIGYYTHAGTATSSITQTIDATSRITSQAIGISSVADIFTGASIAVAGGVGSFDSKLIYDAAKIQVLSVTGTSPFSSTTVNMVNASGYTTVVGTQTGSTPAVPVDLYKANLRLLGSATTASTLTVHHISGATTGGDDVETSVTTTTKTYLRGDAWEDGKVDMKDALAIAQYSVGIIKSDKINVQNGASGRYDTSLSGDMLSMHDAMFIAQYSVHLRDENYNKLW